MIASSLRLSVLLVSAFLVISLDATAPLCSSPNEEDPRTYKFCSAINTFIELYAEAAGERLPEYQASLRDYPQFIEPGMKRQDVVHSFLRFGRRR